MDGNGVDVSKNKKVVPFTGPLSGPRRIWSHQGPKACEFLVGHAQHKLYEDIIHVRNHTDSRWPEQRTPVDQYSDLYCMYVDGQAVGALGVTRALHGDVYLQQFCPPPLIEEFHDALVSAYRFRILSAFRRCNQELPGIALSRFMVREAWRDQIAKGAGLDVINIEKTHVSLYARMGYVLCEGYNYVDPVLGTESSLMFLPVDSGRDSLIRDIIRDSDLQVTKDQVLRCLTRRRVYVNRSAG